MKKKPRKQKRRLSRLPIKTNGAAKGEQVKLPVAIPPDALKDILALQAHVVQTQQRISDTVNGVLMGLGLDGAYTVDIENGQFLPVVSVKDGA